MATGLMQGVFLQLQGFWAGRTDLPQANEFDIGISYDPATVPTLSAIDVINRAVPASLLQDKHLMISSTDRLGRDTLNTVHDDYNSRAALAIIAAKTLQDGPPTRIGWLPGFILAVAVAALWFVVRKPHGGWIALATFGTILLRPRRQIPQTQWGKTRNHQLLRRSSLNVPEHILASSLLDLVVSRLAVAIGNLSTRPKEAKLGVAIFGHIPFIDLAQELPPAAH